MLKALVLGGAACVHEGAERALALFQPDAIFAVNNIGIDWSGRLDYWCTLHPLPTHKWPGMAQALVRRHKAGLNRPQTWAHRPGPGIDRTTGDWAGSSSLFAVKVARLEGFERIVLAGVPMNASYHYNDARPWMQHTAFVNGWRKRAPEIRPFVRSMSGWTRELLGDPSAEWLAELRPQAQPVTCNQAAAS
jgi:hypothetical protein